MKDLEDGSSLNITVLGCTELGNEARAGIQVCFIGNTINYEPLVTAGWAYQAQKTNTTNYLLEDRSWMVHEDQYIKNYLVNGSPLKARIEVKSRSSKPVVKEYILPFEMELE